MIAQAQTRHHGLSPADAYDAYLNLRTALFHFNRLPSQLEDKDELKGLAEEVAKQRSINQAVRASSEYSQVVVPEQELDQSLQEIYEQIPAEVDLNTVLAENGLTLRALREAVSLDLRVAAVLNYIAEQQPHVNDVDAELFYCLHRERFRLPERRRVRHILVTINDDFAENRRENALARIETVRKQLLKKPFKFEKFAKSISECPTALEGGLLGTVTPGQLYPEIDAVLFQMAEGDISEVVESSLGFHLLKCEAISPAQETPFAQVKGKVKGALRKRNQRTAQRQWLKQQMKSFAPN